MDISNGHPVAGRSRLGLRSRVAVATVLVLIAQSVIVTTAAGSSTSFVKDINLGPVIRAHRGTHYFSGKNGTSGVEPWRTRGTRASTFMLKDIAEGPGVSGAGGFMGAGEFMYFTAGSHNALWRTRGTRKSTVMVKPNTWWGAYALGRIGDVVLVAGTRGDQEWELWRTKGTPRTTWRVRDIYPGAGSSDPGAGVVIDGVMYFVADDGEAGREVWRTKGTKTTTHRLRDVRPGPRPSDPRRLTAFGRRLVFEADDGSDLGRQLYISDGTRRGTRRLTSLSSGPAPFQELTAVGKHLYFVIENQLWVTEGKPDTARQVLVPGNGAYRRPHPRSLIAVGDTLYFFASSDSTSHGLFKTKGTSASTELVASIPGEYLREVVNLRGTLYFPGEDPEHGVELWSSRGTAGSTRLVADIAPRAASSDPVDLSAVGGVVYFEADDGQGRRGLWKHTP